ncbi:bifunctional helix-turn-helix transcriptional regulator/GNAT family N-acetyltransferase [Labedaea rhizosphaerae]|uniref:MarR family transcriptional regulator with acetyltransferase activity n=1 Tax=Labedaea rhizosphaerae TaxID=598644 RepID=A0A4R6S729_LABRH|nr:helix-turn-helix domain-containing GNAT family N-acetyltransferase [Labedaea rhizosphaerae]TDP95154.1 MarR family transcriptional regulator with acetyltransferase activity [Labedaea rhizosphaerae]
MTDQAIADVRAFNRFYTNLIGVLDEGLVDSPFSVTEARVLYELAHGEPTEVAELRRLLEVDSGYLSRILARFEESGLVHKQPSTTDARKRVIALTTRGRKAFAQLDDNTVDQIAGLLADLPEAEVRRLTGAMTTIRQVLERTPRPESYVLRPLVAGDLGWVIARHGARYAQEYGWDQTFEALVARILADYAAEPDPAHQAGWIAEVDGEPVGCVFCTRKDEHTAQLRLLLVEPAARGMGIGGRLVEQCLRFAKDAGYREIMLWTNDVLADARRIYQRAGFELEHEAPHHSFGKDLVEQVWRRPL